MPPLKLSVSIAAFVLVLVIVSISVVDTTLHYVPVQGAVVAKSATCFIRNQKHSENMSSCAEARSVTRPGGSYEGWEIKPATVIIYSYVSPVDHLVHTGNARREGEASFYADAGTPWIIYADKRVAEKSRYLAGWALTVQKIISGPPTSDQ